MPISPEVTTNPYDTTPAADVFQFGLLLYELFTDAKFPYNSKCWRSESEMLEALQLLRDDNDDEVLPQLGLLQN
eukprot:UC4_evm1s1404